MLGPAVVTTGLTLGTPAHDTPRGMTPRGVDAMCKGDGTGVPGTLGGGDGPPIPNCLTMG